MCKHIHISEENIELPKEKVVSECIIRIPRGSRVTVVHQNVPPVGNDMGESVTKTQKTGYEWPYMSKPLLFHIEVMCLISTQNS